MVSSFCAPGFKKGNAFLRCFLLLALLPLTAFRLGAQSPTPVSVTDPLTIAAPAKLVTLAKGSCFYLPSCGDGGPLSKATFTNPYDVTFDNNGDLYILDSYSGVVRVVKNTGGNLADRTITTIIGTGLPNCANATSPCGDGGPASQAQFYNPTGIVFNNSGDIFIADWRDNRVRRIDHATGNISTYAGNGEYFTSPNYNSTPATGTTIEPYIIALAPDGTLYITGQTDEIIQAVDPNTQQIRTYAGVGTGAECSSNCEGIPATQINLGVPTAMAVAANGDLYYVSGGHVQKIEKTTGLITTIIGNDPSFSNYPINGHQAKDTTFFSLADILVLPSGDLLLTDDSFPSQIYRVEMSTGRLYVVAGCSGIIPGSPVCTQDNSNPTYPRIPTPDRITMDNRGNIVFTNNSADIDPDSNDPPMLLMLPNIPGTVTFDNTAVGVLSADSPKTPYLMNVGTKPATLTSTAVATTTVGAANSFSLSTAGTVSDGVTSLCATGALAAGSTCGFDLGFQPTAPGVIDGTLTINYSSGNISGAQQVFPLNGTTLTASATVSPVQVAAGTTSTTLTASVTYSGVAPSGAATFTVDGGAAISATCSGTTSPATCTATYNPSSLAAGPHTIAFDVRADSNYTSDITATGTLTITQKPTLVISANDATRLYGTPNPAFTGSVTGQQNGDTVTETFSTTATTASNAGTYAIVPAAQGANLSNYTQTIHAGTLTVTRTGVNLQATSSSATPSFGQSITITAAVASQTTGTPTGSVQFLDNGTPIGTAPLNGTTATLTTSFTGAGAHTISLAYSGDINFLPTSATALSFSLSVQDFSLTLISSGKNINVGQTASYTLRVAPAVSGQTFSSDINFSFYGNFPLYATGQFTPASVKAGSGATDVTFSFVTTRLSLRQTLDRETFVLASLLLPLCLLRRRRLRGTTLLAALLCLFTLTTALTGCGSGYPANSVPVTVTAQSGSFTHSVTFKANVLQTAP